MRQGAWLILDELNLALTYVLEALNRVLDYNRQLYILIFRYVFMFLLNKISYFNFVFHFRIVLKFIFMVMFEFQGFALRFVMFRAGIHSE